MSSQDSSRDVLEQLATVIESRKASNGGDAQNSYVARLLLRAPDSFLKKIGEEATEVVMAAKDLDRAMHSGVGVSVQQGMLVGEVADLWFHCLIAMSHFGLKPSDVLDELRRRAGTSGFEEKALRKALTRERSASGAG
jgi:phosphoribosyl-ATP pyrophosphohydrolase